MRTEHGRRFDVATVLITDNLGRLGRGFPRWRPRPGMIEYSPLLSHWEALRGEITPLVAMRKQGIQIRS